MSLQILSDLHLESPKSYDIFEITPCAPHLALLGDIGNVVPHETELLAFLTDQLRKFRTVLFVPGNHEVYQGDWPAALAILHDFAATVRKDDALGEFVLLDRTSFRLPDTDITILGCSLFSAVAPGKEMAVEMGLNDFFHTTDWNVGAHNTAHKRDLEWLNASVAELEQSYTKTVILTHWSPSVDPRAVDPKHANSPISSAFSTDLSLQHCFTSSRVRLWAFGHTHYNCDFTADRGEGIEPLRLLTNQRGYYFAQAENFEGTKTVQF
ncbi:Ser/Thr protein phosphatase superfamily [Sporormia fimetaria CBS 119925]|uniref:Ser/Thr protein phosphatase superfamily n=1 Tax=Sporormia fimetaria CBS 119925 TaxID=1340428 RepID=A0A6A6V0B8_9PLEO|nr:Ser/Thr protein phosphatase superfamily [Sporormia fimetaria CBS 119925]